LPITIAIMKPEDVLKLVQAGHAVLVGRYLSGVVNARQYMDQKTGKNRELRTIVHTLLAGTKPVLVNEYLPDGTDVNTVVIKQQPGKNYVICIGGYEEDKGVARVRLNGVAMEEVL
jgi:hypothetical protein